MMPPCQLHLCTGFLQLCLDNTCKVSPLLCTKHVPQCTLRGARCSAPGLLLFFLISIFTTPNFSASHNIDVLTFFSTFLFGEFLDSGIVLALCSFRKVLILLLSFYCFFFIQNKSHFKTENVTSCSVYMGLDKMKSEEVIKLKIEKMQSTTLWKH